MELCCKQFFIEFRHAISPRYQASSFSRDVCSTNLGYSCKRTMTSSWIKRKQLTIRGKFFVPEVTKNEEQKILPLRTNHKFHSSRLWESPLKVWAFLLCFWRSSNPFRANEPGHSSRPAVSCATIVTLQVGLEFVASIIRNLAKPVEHKSHYRW